jgi:hypothetical protein
MGSLADKAKQLFQRRGGGTALKEDAQEVRETVEEKAKAAAEAMREGGTAYGVKPETAEQLGVEPTEQQSASERAEPPTP